MTRDEADQVERAIAAVLRHERAMFVRLVDELRDRLCAVERDLAAIETRAGPADLKGDNVTWLKGRRA